MTQTKKGLYFKKDKKAQIFRPVSKGMSTSGYNNGTAYYPIAPSEIWCYSSQLSQTDIFQASAYGQDETRFFVFNHYRGIKPYDIIQYRETWYRVTRTDTADDYDGEVFVYVENAKGGFIPKDSEIMPFTPGIWD